MRRASGFGGQSEHFQYDESLNLRLNRSLELASTNLARNGKYFNLSGGKATGCSIAASAI